VKSNDELVNQWIGKSIKEVGIVGLLLEFFEFYSNKGKVRMEGWKVDISSS
jgi:hypothetical protein